MKKTFKDITGKTWWAQGPWGVPGVTIKKTIKINKKKRLCDSLKTVRVDIFLTYCTEEAHAQICHFFKVFKNSPCN